MRIMYDDQASYDWLSQTYGGEVSPDSGGKEIMCPSSWSSRDVPAAASAFVNSRRNVRETPSLPSPFLLLLDPISGAHLAS